LKFFCQYVKQCINFKHNLFTEQKINTKYLQYNIVMLYWRYLVFIFCGLCLSDFFHVPRETNYRKTSLGKSQQTMRCITPSIMESALYRTPL